MSYDLPWRRQTRLAGPLIALRALRTLFVLEVVAGTRAVVQLLGDSARDPLSQADPLGARAPFVPLPAPRRTRGGENSHDIVPSKIV